MLARHDSSLSRIGVATTLMGSRVRRNPNNLGYCRNVATARERDRCRERLTRLSESRLDTEPIQREAIAELRRVIGFDRWCWTFADPQTLIPLGGVAEHDYGPGVA